MSCTFIITTTVVANWPAICAAATAAAAAMGFKIAEKITKTSKQNKVTENIELEIEGSEILTDKMRADEEIFFSRGDIKVRLYKDPRGKCAIHVAGEGKSKKELVKEGELLMNKIKQQYAYQKVTQELKAKGFSITNQEVSEEGKIRICLRKF